MTTKDLIAELAASRRLASKATTSEAAAYHLAEFQRLALKLAHKQADKHDRHSLKADKAMADLRAAKASLRESLLSR